ncbi:SEC-C metal-binding domain-containing protein [Klebsiella pneumoniae]|nr:SEC-C metal-binding domain-containing protein [Klebsiella pneumoniae]
MGRNTPCPCGSGVKFKSAMVRIISIIVCITVMARQRNRRVLP